METSKVPSKHPALELKNVEKRFDSFVALQDLNFKVQPGAFVAIVGPSGCGKSTLLRLIAGLEASTDGEIWLDNEDVTEASAGERGLAMVFQSYALYPHKTVRENMAFSLKIAKRPKAEIESRVAEAARALQLEAYLDRLPKQLSGGQRQRVAIGRAIVRQPKVFLFDEPLSNLDAALRAETRVELAELHQRLAATMIYVTHDQVEAMTLADQIIILNAGKIQQMGSPKELYNEPKNAFVAGFIGSPKMNFISGTIADATFRSADLSVPGLTHIPPGSVTLGVRPEALMLAENGRGIGEVEVSIVEYLGDESVIHGRLSDDTHIILREKGGVDLNTGDKVSIDVESPDALHFFSPESGERIARPQNTQDKG
jgi:multiple sugar transport system ATP-binding protein